MRPRSPHDVSVRTATRPAGATVAVCTAATGLGAALGFVPGYVATELQHDLRISRAGVGLIVSLYFGATGAGSIVGGRLTERFGARRVVTADLVLVATCAWLAAASGRYEMLLATSVAAGAGYAWANAGTNSAIGLTVPARRRTMAMSAKTAGVPAMAAISAALATPAANRWSWNAVWVAVGCCAILAASAVWIVLDDVVADPVSAGRGPAPPRSTWWFALAAFLLVGGSQPLYSWIVPYLEETFDASAVGAGAIASVAAAVGVVTMILNGVAADRRGVERRISHIVWLTAGSAVAVAVVWAGPWLGIAAVAGATVAGIALQLAAIGTMHAAIVDRAPDAVARATGITMTGYYLGALASPVGFGALVDVTGTYASGWFVLTCLLALSVPAWRMGGRHPVRPV